MSDKSLEAYNVLLKWAKKRLRHINKYTYEQVIAGKAGDFDLEKFKKRLVKKYNRLYRGKEVPDYILERLLCLNTTSNQVFTSGDSSSGDYF